MALTYGQVGTAQGVQLTRAIERANLEGERAAEHGKTLEAWGFQRVRGLHADLLVAVTGAGQTHMDSPNPTRFLYETPLASAIATADGIEGPFPKQTELSGRGSIRGEHVRRGRKGKLERWTGDVEARFKLSLQRIHGSRDMLRASASFYGAGCGSGAALPLKFDPAKRRWAGQANGESLVLTLDEHFGVLDVWGHTRTDRFSGSVNRR